MKQLLVLFAVLALPLALVAGEAYPAAPALQTRLLNAIDSPAVPGLGGWQVEALAVRVAKGVEPRLGAAAIEIAGTAKAGGKVDAPFFDGELPGCRRLAVWVSVAAASNAKEFGFQIRDAKGEWLLQTVPIDWTGWKRVELDPTAGGMKPAYAQKDHDGKVDLPITAVHLIWFAKAAGATSLVVDGLTAGTEVQAGADGLVLTPLAASVLEPGQPLRARFIAENRGATEKTVAIRWNLQANPTFVDPVIPDPIQGFDHALGCRSTWSVDGTDRGDAKLCDGDEFTHSETPWGKGYTEAVATIDLGQARDVSAVRWQAGDANWIFKADLSTSTDQAAWQPVASAQGVTLQGKWGGPHSFPIVQPVKARYLRIRFHNDGKSVNCLRLPPTIMVYDGIANDTVVIPTVGPTVASGTAQGQVPAHDLAEIVLSGSDAVAPGGYLLGLEQDLGGRKEVRWSQLFVRPSDQVDTRRTRRFGINGASIALAEEMRRCGFGWIRFENCKWMFFSPARDQYAFDGSVGPWHVPHDSYFADYHKLGINVLPYVFMVPDWAHGAPSKDTKNTCNYPPKDNADYGEAIFQLVARMGSATVAPAQLKTADKKSGLKLIDAVELWNEPNLNDPNWGPYVGTMAQYFDTLRAGVEGARRADPTLPVSGAGMAGIDLAVIGQFAEHHYADGQTPLDLIDIVNVHFYSGREEPEICGWDPNVARDVAIRSGVTYPDQIEDLVAWRDQLKPKAELWLSEIGNDVGGPIGRTERVQATKVPRAVMIALAAGVDKVMIYRESGSDPAMHAGAGLLRNDRSLRPVWFSVATMIRQLQGFHGRALRLPSDDPAVWMYLWEDGPRKLITAWRYAGTSQFGVDLGQTTVCDGFGRSTTVVSTTGVVLSELPTYITITAPSPALDKLVAAGRAGPGPLRRTCPSGQPARGPDRLRSPRPTAGHAQGLRPAAPLHPGEQGHPVG